MEHMTFNVATMQNMACVCDFKCHLNRYNDGIKNIPSATNTKDIIWYYFNEYNLKLSEQSYMASIQSFNKAFIDLGFIFLPLLSYHSLSLYEQLFSFI